MDICKMVQNLNVYCIDEESHILYQHLFASLPKRLSTN